MKLVEGKYSIIPHKLASHVAIISESKSANIFIEGSEDCGKLTLAYAPTKKAAPCDPASSWWANDLRVAANAFVNN